MTAKMNVPALRFPEFEGAWQYKQIGTSIELLTGFPFDGEEITENKEGVLLMRGTNISEGFFRHNEELNRYYCGDIDKLDKYRLNKGDVVLGMDGSKVGRNSAIVDDTNEGALLIQRVARIRALPTSSIGFLYQHINSFYFHNYVDKVKTSSGIPHISAKQIKEFSIFFPSLPEQQKIAAFLTAVDDKIQQLTRKKALLEQYKKGVMQQLFSQQLRFTDDAGNDFPDWEEKTLGEIASKVGSGSTPKGGEKAYVEYGIPFIRSQNVNNGQLDLTNLVYITEEIHAKMNGSAVKANDILLNITGASIGRSCVVPNDFLIGNVNQHVCIIRLKEGYEPFYLHAFLSSNDGQNIIEQSQSGSGREGLNFQSIRRIKTSFPCKVEQQKIASFLSAIDEKINHVTTQLQHTQQWKKGLLQQMFV